MDESFQDLPYELEIEVTTSESPVPANDELVANSGNTNNSHVHTSNSSPSALTSMLTPESLHTENEFSNCAKSFANVPLRSNQDNTKTPTTSFSVPLSPCSIRNSPTPSSSSDSTIPLGSGGIPVSTIQWACKYSAKEDDKSKSQDASGSLVKVEVSRDKLDTNEDVDEVVYIGEYRPLYQSKPASLVSQCPQCFYRSNATVPKKLTLSSQNLGNHRFNPMYWRNLTSTTSHLINQEAYWNACQRQPRLYCNSCQPMLRQFPSLFPEPPESEWLDVRVYHMEPKQGVNLRAYTNHV